MKKRFNERQATFLALFAPLNVERIRKEVRHMVTGDYSVEHTSLVAMLAAKPHQARIAVFLAFAGVWDISFPNARALYKSLQPSDQQQLNALLDEEILDARSLWKL